MLGDLAAINSVDETAAHSAVHVHKCEVFSACCTRRPEFFIAACSNCLGIFTEYLRKRSTTFSVICAYVLQSFEKKFTFVRARACVCVLRVYVCMCVCPHLSACTYFSVLQEGLRPFHRCRWKRSLFTPYLRYKEEILSVKPFVSLFYDIIHDAEAEHLKKIARDKV